MTTCPSERECVRLDTAVEGGGESRREEECKDQEMKIKEYSDDIILKLNVVAVLGSWEMSARVGLMDLMTDPDNVTLYHELRRSTSSIMGIFGESGGRKSSKRQLIVMINYIDQFTRCGGVKSNSIVAIL